MGALARVTFTFLFLVGLFGLGLWLGLEGPFEDIARTGEPSISDQASSAARTLAPTPRLAAGGAGASRVQAAPSFATDVAALRNWGRRLEKDAYAGTSFQRSFESWVEARPHGDFERFARLALDEGTPLDARFLAAYALGLATQASIAPLAVRVAAAPLPARGSQKYRGPDARLRALALERWTPERLGERERAQLGRLAATSPSFVLRHQAARALTPIEARGRLPFAALLGERREPSQLFRRRRETPAPAPAPTPSPAAPPAPVFPATLAVDGDVATSARLAGDYGIQWESFETPTNPSEGAEKLGRLLRALTLIENLRFKPHPRGFVDDDYPRYIRDRIGSITYKPMGPTPDTLAQLWSDPRNTPAHRHSPGRADIFDAGLVQDSLGLAATLIHEARHNDGMPHVDCTRREATKTCDASFSAGRAWGVELEFVARIAVYGEGLSDFERTKARILALDLSEDGFNEAPLRPALGVVALADRSLHVLTRSESRPLGSLGDDQFLLAGPFGFSVATSSEDGRRSGWVDPSSSSLALIAKIEARDAPPSLLSEENRIKDGLLRDVVATDSFRSDKFLQRAICKRRVCHFQRTDFAKSFTSSLALSLPHDVERVRFVDDGEGLEAAIGFKGRDKAYVRVQKLLSSPTSIWAEAPFPSGPLRRAIGATEVRIQDGKLSLAPEAVAESEDVLPLWKRLREFKRIDDLQSFETWNWLVLTDR